MLNKFAAKKWLLPLLMLWQLPQNLLGIVVLSVFYFKSAIVKINSVSNYLHIETNHTGVSLGSFIFWTPAANRYKHLDNDCLMHELGHARQSLFLGPLYLIIIGIPSISRVLYQRWYRYKYAKHWKGYYKGFPENWADKLGGIHK